MENIIEMFKDKKVQVAYIISIVGLQLIVNIVTHQPILNFITTLFGALYVSTLVFKRKLTFFWSLFFNAGMLVTGVQNGVFSEMIQQPMFFLVNLAGLLTVFNINHLKPLHRMTNKLGKTRAVVVNSSVIIFMIVWTFVSMGLGSRVPLHDGVLGGLAITAQIFSIVGNNSSWFGWVALNFMSFWTWITLGNFPMALMYVIFLINAIFGYVMWSKTNIEFKEL